MLRICRKINPMQSFMSIVINSTNINENLISPKKNNRKERGLRKSDLFDGGGEQPTYTAI